MRFKQQNWKPSLAERRAFGLMLAAGMPVSGVIWFLLVRWSTGEWRWSVPVMIIAIGGGLGLFLALIPSLARPFYCLWYFFVLVIDVAVTNTLMTMLYFGVVTPYALVARLRRLQPILKRPRRDVPTYWQEAEKPSDLRRYFRQF
jgi:hypothetical protein